MIVRNDQRRGPFKGTVRCDPLEPRRLLAVNAGELVNPPSDDASDSPNAAVPLVPPVPPRAPSDGPVDLVPTAVGKVSAVVAGGSAKKVSVRVENRGTGTQADPFTVRLFTSVDAALGAGDAEVGVATATVRLRPGAAKTVKVTASYPLRTSAGAAYHLVARVEGAGETDAAATANNVVASAGQVRIRALPPSRAVAFADPVAAAIDAGLGAYGGSVLGDFDGDGNRDVVAYSTLDNVTADGAAPATARIRFQLFRGAGDGRLLPQPVVSAVDVAAGQAFAAQAGDFDGDGRSDLLLYTSGVTDADPTPRDRLVAFHGAADGTFAGAQTVDLTALPPLAGKGLTPGPAADYDGDGRTDVMFVSGDGTVVVLRQPLASDRPTTAEAAGAATTAVGQDDYTLARTADVNGDGKADVALGTGSLIYRAVAGEFPPHPVLVLLGSGDGTFGPPAAVTVPDVPSPRLAGIADINRDGKPDLRLADAASRAIEDFEQFWVAGNGDGTFDGSADGTSTYEFTPLGDFNGDGVADTTSFNRATSENPFSVNARLGNGDGTFGDRVALPAVSPDATLVSASTDFTNDGRADVLYQAGVGYALIPSRPAALSAASDDPFARPGEDFLPGPQLVPGTAGRLAARVSDAGAEAFAGPVRVTVYASIDSRFDPLTDVVVGTLDRTLGLKVGQSKSVRVAYELPSTLPTGIYRLFVRAAAAAG